MTAPCVLAYAASAQVAKLTSGMDGEALQGMREKQDAEWEERILELADAQQVIDSLYEKLHRAEKNSKHLKKKVAIMEQQRGAMKQLAEQNKDLQQRNKTLKGQLSRSNKSAQHRYVRCVYGSDISNHA